MKIRLTLTFLFFLLFAGGQVQAGAAAGRPPVNPGSISQLFSRDPFINLNTAGSEFYLSEDEKLLIALCNLARWDGEAFIREVLVPSGKDTSSTAVKNLTAKLRTCRRIAPLMPAYSLHKTALSHARDMGFKGDSGHTGSDGLSFQQRISRYFPNHAGFAENFHLGSGDPTEIVLAFLSAGGDKQVYSDNILSPGLHYIGVSIQPHRNSCSDAVIDFARKPESIPGSVSSGQKRKRTEAYFMDCPDGSQYKNRKKSHFSFRGLFSRRK